MKDSKYYCEQLSLNCSDNKDKITFLTTKGDFKVKLFEKSNPVTVANFKRNINDGIYKDKKFYKIIKFPNSKIIHSGILENTNFSNIEDQYTFQSLSKIPLEIGIKNQKEPKYNSFPSDPMNREDLKNYFKKGSIAMVKIGKNNSSSTEFFFSLNTFPALDGRYAIFGKVISGLEVLKKLDIEDKIIQIITSN